jgi:transcription antitermination factor NusG
METCKMMISMQAPSPQWFALYTAPRHEKLVSSQLKHWDIESFLPLHRTLHCWKNRTRAAVELPLFPSYVFVRISPDMKGRVLAVPGALSVVGSKREPWPLPEAEMEILRAGLDHCKPEPYPYLAAGDRVRIAAGPLAGMEGFFVDRKNGQRVILTIPQIMRSVSVEVEIQHLELVNSDAVKAS